MTINSVFTNPTTQATDVSSNLRSSQSASAANTVSAKFPHQVNPNSTTRSHCPAKSTFASMTQAYKDSYDKYQKDKGSLNFNSVRSLFLLEEILESEDFVTQRQEENNDAGRYHTMEYIA
jgi:hypothetical protein